MSNVPLNQILKHVHASGVSFRPGEVDVGAGSTYTISGTGKGMTFVAKGTNQHLDATPNAIIVMTDGQDFAGVVDLGPYSELKITSIGLPNGYVYTPQHGNVNGHITFEYEFGTTGREFAEWNIPLNTSGPIKVGVGPGGVDITTGRGPFFGATYEIYPHTA